MNTDLLCCCGHRRLKEGGGGAGEGGGGHQTYIQKMLSTAPYWLLLASSITQLARQGPLHDQGTEEPYLHKDSGINI